MTDRQAEDRVQGGAEGAGGCLDLRDLDSLASLARSSEDHEAYRAVAAREDFRIGLVASVAPDMSTSFRIEVLLQILAKDSQPKVADLERMSKVLETLAERGYSLDHHDSCWVLCERHVVVDDIEKECKAVVEIIQSEKAEKKRRTSDRRRGV